MESSTNTWQVAGMNAASTLSLGQPGDPLPAGARSPHTAPDNDCHTGIIAHRPETEVYM